MMFAKSVLRTSVLLVGLSLQIARSELHLEQLQVVFRHGERTPRAVEMYPNDPYNASIYEPMGLGQLTNQGKMTEYRIGKMLRNRYNGFLSEIYRPGDVLAFSSDVDRTKMSLLLTLAGLYPPTASQTWNTNLQWMPVPIHSAPEKLDLLIKPHQNPIYSEALKKLRKSVDIRKKVSEFNDFFKFLSEKTGLNLKDSSEVFEIYHLLTAQKSMNLTWPEWCTIEVYKRIEDVLVLDYHIRSYTTQLKKLNGGMLIRKFIQNMNLNNERTVSRKVYLYGGHEVNIAAVARAHNFTYPKVPDYGSAIVVEKLRDDNGKVFVRMLYWTGVTGELFAYKLDDCDTTCPIEKYLEIVRDVVPTDEEMNEVWSKITMESVRKYFDEKF